MGRTSCEGVIRRGIEDEKGIMGLPSISPSLSLRTSVERGMELRAAELRQQPAASVHRRNPVPQHPHPAEAAPRCGRAPLQPHPPASAPRYHYAPLQARLAASPPCYRCAPLQPAQLHLRPATAAPRWVRAQLHLHPATVVPRCSRAQLHLTPTTPALITSASTTPIKQRRAATGIVAAGVLPRAPLLALLLGHNRLLSDN